MNFGQAVEMLKRGRCMARKGWNGKGMFLFLRKGSTKQLDADRPELIGGVCSSLFVYATVQRVEMPHLVMQTADGSLVPWLASQTDILAEDWEVSA